MSARCRPDCGASGCMSARWRPGGLAYLAGYRRDLQPMTPLLVGCVRSLKPVTPLLSEVSLKWGVVGRQWCQRLHECSVPTQQWCRWTVTAHGRASRRRAAARQPTKQQAITVPPDWRLPRGLQGLAAVPVGGGRARAGLEIDHSEPQARVWRSRGRAATHRHTQRPGPSRQATRRPETRRGEATQPIRRGHKRPQPVRTPRSTRDPGRPGDRRGGQVR